jgi:hypothetical protein
MPDFYAPINAQLSAQAAQEMCADFKTDLLARTNLKLQLVQNNVTPRPGNTLANFQIANFSGYADFTVSTFSAVALDSNNNAFMTSNIANFACSGAGVSNTIYGSVLVGTPSGGVLATATNTGSGTGYSPIFTIVSGGAGYTAPPPVSLTGANGAGAAAHSVLNANGSVNEIIDSAGTGYTTYTVVLGPPLELIKQNVLSTGGISMALSTDQIPTFTQIVVPSVAA